MEPLEKSIGDFVSNMSKDNITMEALQNFFKDNNGKKAVSITSFSSATKYSSATFDKETFVLGAPEFVLRTQYAEFQKGNEK